MTQSILSPDVHDIIEAIKSIDPEYNLSEHLVAESMRVAIQNYSEAAGSIIIGKNNDFCRGVILTLELHKLGKL